MSDTAGHRTDASRGEQRELGATGIQVTVVGLGTWAMGSQWGEQEDEESVRTLHHALDEGCRFLDTALAYGQGRSERLIARVFRERGERVPVATKIPPKDYQWETVPGVTKIQDKFPAQYIIDSCETSLRNLGADTIDVLQLHTWCSGWTDELEWYETMVKLRDQGKIRAIGVSVPDARPDEANGLIAAERVDSVQLIYNILDQRAAPGVFPLAREHHVGILARVPLASGALAGKWSSATTFSEGDWRAEVFTGNTLERTLDYVRQLRFLEAGSDGSLVEAAVRFAFSDPAVTTTIPGARNPGQVDPLMRAMERGPLSLDELAQLRALWDTQFSQYIQTSIQPVAGAGASS